MKSPTIIMDEDKSDRLEAKVDSMQGTIDRMSKQMDDYLTQRDIEYVPGTKVSLQDYIIIKKLVM